MAEPSQATVVPAVANAPAVPPVAGEWDIQPVIDWLVHDGRLIVDAPKLIDALAARLLAAGAPLWRLRIGLQAIHPLYRTMGLLWRRGEPVQQEGRPHGIEKTPDYIGSPIQELVETRRPVRYRLDRLGNENHEMLHALAAEGGTDYYAAPVPVAHGRWPAITFATDRKGGFTDTDIAKFQSLLDHLGPILEGHISHLVTTTLMNTYLGRIVGEQILSGLIKRGDGQSINAVLWFSDLRDFTGLNERLGSTELLELLNNYLQLVGDALGAHGGEILKFIGDGVMGYFPAEDALFLPMVTGNALNAARRLIDDVDSANSARATFGHDPVRFGIGLHVGVVTFGNIGTEDRLDFTVIGPAVNRAARLESLTKELHVPVCASAEFNDVCMTPMLSLGKHMLKGVPEAVEVFTLPS